MSPLWVLPLIVIAVGAVAVAFAARGTLAASRQLQGDLRGLRALADELGDLRAGVDLTRRRAVELADLRARARSARLAGRAGGHDVDR